uniref:MTTase N-terminal domain-containing protein n=1 Tax=Pavo cristatus TaxID=9049 RepID=A0A8C9FMI0_PAVCR
MPAACDSVLEDIEDIVSAQDLKPHDWRFVRKNVFPKVRKRSSQLRAQTDDDPPHDSVIPGIQKIWIRTWGCSHNNSDGEYMAGQLAAYGYKITAFAHSRGEAVLSDCSHLTQPMQNYVCMQTVCYINATSYFWLMVFEAFFYWPNCLTHLLFSIARSADVMDMKNMTLCVKQKCGMTGSVPRLISFIDICMHFAY